MKVVWICTCRTSECIVFNQCYRNPFWNWTELFIIDSRLLGPRTRSELFNLSVSNRTMCVAFNSHNIGTRKKNLGLQFNLSDKKSSV